MITLIVTGATSGIPEDFEFKFNINPAGEDRNSRRTTHEDERTNQRTGNCT